MQSIDGTTTAREQEPDERESASQEGRRGSRSRGGGPHPGAEARSRPELALDAELDALLGAALAEDVGSGDVTSTASLPATLVARGRLHAKAAGVASGLTLFARVFSLLDPAARVTSSSVDGDAFESGDTLLVVEASARALVTGERTALNLVQRLSGIATLTNAYVRRAAPVQILDTRKTTPGLRRLEKYAVRCGGGVNHRFGLFDQAMLKNNHVDLTGRSLADVIADLRAAQGPDFVITAEARDEAEAEAAIDGGADVVLLDNMSPERLGELGPVLRRRAQTAGRTVVLEASGGITLESVAAFAASGVDRISVGALTHSAPALDLAFAVERLA